MRLPARHVRHGQPLHEQPQVVIPCGRVAQTLL
jgi:hypothetical protein